MHAQGGVSARSFAHFPPISVRVNIPQKEPVDFSILRPDDATMRATVEVAKQIFVKAFTISYTRYYEEAKPGVSIEEWLKLKTDFKTWLSNTFDEEFQEYEQGKKGFIYLNDSQNNLVGWLSHSPVDEKGDVYLSQGSLNVEWSNQKVASTALAEMLNQRNISTIFPEAHELKLIVRRTNEVAKRIYTAAEFTCDETIKPEVYGSSYSNLYIGFRRLVNFQPKVISDAWGTITLAVNGKEATYKDVVILPSDSKGNQVALEWNWKWEKDDKDQSYGMSHQPGIRIKDVEHYILSHPGSVKPDVIILSQGRGHGGQRENPGPGILAVESDVQEYLTGKGIEVHILKTGPALEKYQQLIAEGKKRVAALIHTTC